MAKPVVLIVEDNVAVSRVVADVLMSLGCEAIIEHDGRHALRRIRAQRPALVLVDMRLPGMDGLELVREIRASKGLEAVRLIGMTGYAHAILEKDIRDAGCDAFLEKPFDLEALRRTIGKFIEIQAQ